MADPFGWLAVDTSGLQHFFTGAQPPSGFATVTELAASSDYSAAIAAARAAPPASLALAQSIKTATLNQECAAAILGGFTSSALGSSHSYGSNEADQANLAMDMIDAGANSSATADINCSENGSTWAVASHTAAQILILGADFRTWRAACQAKNWAYRSQVTAATTVSAVQAIVWA